MKTRLLLACLFVVACSQEGNAGSGRNVALAIDRPETQTSASFTLASADFQPNGPIPLRFSAYGDGVSPALAWSGLPAGTRSLALMMEDPDASSAKPFVHWLAWNIDPSKGSLSEGSVTVGARLGRNSRGSPSYFGPRPPGQDPHHYHFQMFALDTPLDLKPGASRDQLLAAMNGHVLAKADLVGLFGRPR